MDTFQKACAVTAKVPDEGTVKAHRNMQTEVELDDVLADIINLGQRADEIKRTLFYREAEGQPLSPELTRYYRAIHAILGIQSELEELLQETMEVDELGNEFPEFVPLYESIPEEGGDLGWYLMELFSSVGYEASEAFTKVVDKLKMRHGDKFKEDNFETRNIEEEQKLYEEGC